MFYNFLADSAVTTSSAAESVATGGFNYTWIFLGVIVVLMIVYFFISSRRRKKQEDEIEKMMDALKVGDKVLTIGRWYAEIVEILPDGKYVVKSGSDNYPGYLTIERAAIAHIFSVDENAESAQTENGEAELPPDMNETFEDYPEQKTEEASAEQPAEEQAEKAENTEADKKEEEDNHIGW